MQRLLTACIVTGTLALGSPIYAGAAKSVKPKGATAACKDGTYSRAKTQQGACSAHGGVAKWLAATPNQAKTKTANKTARATRTI